MAPLVPRRAKVSTIKSVDQSRAQTPTPLQGKKILVTRPREQASRFAALLREYGAEPIEVPTIQIAPPASWEPLDQAIAALASYDWLVFTSVNGVRAFLARLELQHMTRADVPRPQLCAIGPETAKALQAHGLRVEVVPREYRAEAVVEALAAFPLGGRRILLARAAVARDILPRALAARGAHVDVVEAYRTVLPTDGIAPEVRHHLACGDIEVVTFTSSSTVTNFATLMGDTDLSQLLRRVVVACIGPVTAETAQAYGLTPAIVAADYTIPGLTRAIVEYYQGIEAPSRTGLRHGD
jgi:uroporphyrinogen III methyltransferase/synthase